MVLSPERLISLHVATFGMHWRIASSHEMQISRSAYVRGATSCIEVLGSLKRSRSIDRRVCGEHPCAWGDQNLEQDSNVQSAFWLNGGWKAPLETDSKPPQFISSSGAVGMSAVAPYDQTTEHPRSSFDGKGRYEADRLNWRGAFERI